MNPNREELLFQLAWLKPFAEHAAFLARECVGEEALCQRLEASLAAQEQSASVPAAGL